MMFSRAERTVLSDWWFSVDKGLLAAAVILAVYGTFISLATTPHAAVSLGEEPFYFVKRHAVTAFAALVLVFLVSLLDARQIRRLALFLFAGGLLLMALTLWQGIERNGAARWLFAGGLALQPSELVKPGFIVLAAWCFAESTKRPDMPALPLAVLILVLFVSFLVLQPDMGQAVLIVGVWSCLFFLAGHSLKYAPAVILLTGVAAAAAYASVPHFARRIDIFLGFGGDSHQADMAAAAFQGGGWFGRGLGEGVVKARLPDAHNDYVFAALAEELGIAACLLLVLIYAFVTWRALAASWREEDAFVRLAIMGLIMIFGFQALTNMGVNLNLLPAKGVTLPFVSYGRSSLISAAVTLGMILSLTRRWREAGGHSSVYPSNGIWTVRQGGLQS